MERIQPMLRSLVDYPVWLWLPCVILVAAALLWLIIKLCQWTFRIFVFACVLALFAGGAYLLYLLLARP